MSKLNEFDFDTRITKIMQDCSGLKSLDKLNDMFSELFDEISAMYEELESSKSANESIAKGKEYEQKIVAIKRFWTTKILLDTNLNLIGKEIDYHKKFKAFSFDIEEIKSKISQTNETYVNYIYSEWLKLKFRLEQNMNWDEGYSQDKVYGKFRKLVDSNISKFYNKIIDDEPNAFYKQTNREYSNQQTTTITKQFLSKFIAAVQNTNIEFDKHKFSESFGIKYDDTVRTAYNKINKTGNDSVKRFINSFWMYLTNDEKKELISAFTKYLNQEKPR